MLALDSTGITGYVFFYSMCIAFGGATLLIFLYLWRRGSLDFSEGPKEQMMRGDEQAPVKGERNG